MRAATPQVGREATSLGISAPLALLTWVMCWFGGNLLGSAVIAATGRSAQPDVGLPTWVTLLGALALWSPMVGGVVWASRAHGSGSLRTDVGLRFEPVDLLGIPLGIACQLVVVRVVYLPLEAIWPDTFGDDRVEESARRLYEAAEGWWLVGLVLMVVVGAPVVEELVYRGLLQGALVRRMRPVIAVVLVAGLFALVHFRPVQYPGLFVFGVVLGLCALRTGRLGMAITAHAGFNAAGLAWVALG
jgi:hypothetical protein